MTFVDSSFWIARFVRNDSRYEEARTLSLAVADRRLATSNLVVGETWTYLRRKRGHREAMTWLDGVTGQIDVQVVPVDRDLEAEAWGWLRTHHERPYSFVNATSFALMRKLRIRDALAFDGDFAAAGFTELRV